MSTKSIAVISITLLSIVTGSASAQSCETSVSSFSSPDSELDAIVLEGSGGNLGYTLRAGADASGRVAVLWRGECQIQEEAGGIDRALFDDFLNQARLAIEEVRDQPDRSDTAEHFDDILRYGRIEGLCLAPVDGFDINLTLYVSGEAETFPCVTGALREYVWEFLQVVASAAGADAEVFGQ